MNNPSVSVGCNDECLPSLTLHKGGRLAMALLSSARLCWPVIGCVLPPKRTQDEAATNYYGKNNTIYYIQQTY